MRKLDKWDILFYLSMLVLVIWTILKSTGIINTPAWIEYGIPFSGFIVGVFTIFQKFTDKLNKVVYALGKLQTKTNYIEKDVRELKDDVSTLKTDVSTLKTDVSTLKTKVTHIDSILAKNNLS
jgi:hypothetical protein